MKSAFFGARMLVLLLVVLLPGVVRALTVSPMSIHIDPSRGGGYQTIIATNTSDRTIALETYVERRSVDATGAQRLDRDDDDFLVFPPLASLAPGASQAFRVQWIGDLGSVPSALYYVTVLKLPVSLESLGVNQDAPPKDEAHLLLRLSYAFKISVGVATKGSRPNLTAQALGPGPRARNGKPTVAVRIVNGGRAYTRLDNFSWTLTKTDGQNFMSAFGDWGAEAGVSLFPAGHSRTINIPVPDEGWTSGVTVDLRPLR